MGKQKIRIIESEEKTSQNGKKYNRFKIRDEKGEIYWASCWDAIMSAAMREAGSKEGVVLEVEIAEKDNWKNIIKIHDVAIDTEAALDLVPETPGKPKPKSSNGFHLTPEQTRCNAIMAAIEIFKSGKAMFDESHVLTKAATLEEWILRE